MTDVKALEKQLCARYPKRTSLERFLKHNLNLNLELYAAADLNLTDAVFELVKHAKAECWLGDLEAAMRSDSQLVMGGSGVWELLDLATFDMQPLEAAFVEEQVRAGTRRVVGVTVAVTSNKFVRYFCTRLQRVLGRDHTYFDSDGTTLNPDLASVEVALRQVLIQEQKLRRRNVVCPVWCDRVEPDTISDFWARVRGEMGRTANYLVLVMVTSLDRGLPDEVVVLPTPQVVERDLRVWTVRVANELGWPTELARAWLRRLVTQSTIGEEINVSIVYGLMDRDATRVLGEQADLEQELRELVEEAG
jgi:hypothetical protein